MTNASIGETVFAVEDGEVRPCIVRNIGHDCIEIEPNFAPGRFFFVNRMYLFDTEEDAEYAASVGCDTFINAWN